MANFSDLLKEYGSVEKALSATGATKNSDGSWTASDGSSGSSTGTSGSSGSTSGKSGSSAGSGAASADPASVSSGGTAANPYANTDYHAAAVAAAKAGDWAGVLQNLDWREQKINEQYGGVYGDKKTNAQILQELRNQYPQAYIDYESGASGATGGASALAAQPASATKSSASAAAQSASAAALPASAKESAPEYGGSEWDAVLDRLAKELASMSYADWTGGDDYAALSARYSDAGQQAMQDVLGQISSRTGGLASSYAAVAANRQYSDYMSQLEEVARQMYEDERSEKLESAQLARQLAGEDYERYLDLLEQWNTGRKYDYDIWRANTSDRQAADKLAQEQSQFETRLAQEQSQLESKLAQEQLQFESKQAASGGGTSSSGGTSSGGTSGSTSGSTGSGSKSSGTSGSGTGSGKSEKPALTAAQALAAAKAGQASETVISAVDYYYGEGYYERYFGSGSLSGVKAQLDDLLSRGVTNRAALRQLILASGLSAADQAKLITEYCH